ncbi:DUF1501 domain-containing protein [Blastopirellula sp. J2-11]|uniref:DUF1501 domain-containing protein n=1 Tax=Blastopirellula sp. J2-11 TaxID=2943192 RepID=UPI0021CAE145|nr:DUF1501 domain-containing protein [Blastopirellula sp. J2-11]UUO04566.1 DUF1501 domain-containing protein [Blastopirellula sp. J2-11]
MARSLKLSRRDYLRMAALGVGFGATSGWLEALAREASESGTKNKAVIMLWLSGGPATIDMWDLKPGNVNGGEFQEIQTATPGVRISEHMPKLAANSNELAIIRSMTSKEGDHGRATQFVQTGYVPQGAIKFPSIGALCAHEIGDRESDLPSFVSISPGRQRSLLGGGFLGPEYSPLVIGGQRRGEQDLIVPDLSRTKGVSDETQNQRLAMLSNLDKSFHADRPDAVVSALHSASQKALRLMRPEAASSFRLDDEPVELRDRYGRNTFGQGCLMARRLVERGISFVEVTLGGWDTHNDNFSRVKELSTTLDTGFAALLEDLKQRGMLESTVVMCQGEFGRTPRINGRSGRDHWPQTWATVLAGGGIRGGQALGATNENGTEVIERPVVVPDVIATVCETIGVNPMKQNMSNVGRPIRIADPEAMPIEELL